MVNGQQLQVVAHHVVEDHKELREQLQIDQQLQERFVQQQNKLELKLVIHKVVAAVQQNPMVIGNQHQAVLIILIHVEQVEEHIVDW